MPKQKEEKKPTNGEEGEDKKKKPEDETKKEETTAEKRLAELEKKLGEQGSAFTQLKEFTDGASIVIQTIAGDPELAKVFQTKLKERYGKQVSGEQPPEDSKKKESPDKSSDEIKSTVDDVAKSQRRQIIASFEERFGIDKMKSEEANETRKKVAGYLADFGWQVETVPLQILAQNLEKAYVGTHAEKLREEGKLEGIAKAREIASGTMPTMGGGVPATGQKKGLTEGQKGWAKKLGVDEEKAAKRYEGREEEQTRVSPAEKKE